MRVLFSSTPGEGHVRPLLPLARALKSRGHEVVFATATEWERRLADYGFPMLPAGIEREAARRFVRPEELREVPPDQMRVFLFPRIFGQAQAPAKLPDLLEHLTAWPPDVIVYESADLAAPVAAATHEIPVVNHSFGVTIPLPVLEAAAEVVEPLWRQHGLEPDPLCGAFRGLYVDIAPSSLSPEPPPGNVVQLRPAEPSRSPAAAPAGVETPFVYATMGTIWNEPHFFRVLLDALDGLPALLTTGRGKSVDGPVADGVVVAEFLPQEDVLPHARAVVAHAGSGTMLGALAHGLPLVLVPQGADQFDNAAACARAGVAVVVGRGEADVATIRAALDRILAERSFAEAAAAIADEIAAMPSADEVAARIEEHVAAG